MYKLDFKLCFLFVKILFYSVPKKKKKHVFTNGNIPETDLHNIKRPRYYFRIFELRSSWMNYAKRNSVEVGNFNVKFFVQKHKLNKFMSKMSVTSTSQIKNYVIYFLKFNFSA